MYLRPINNFKHFRLQTISSVVRRTRLIILFAFATLFSASTMANADGLIRWPTLNFPSLLLTGETIKAEVDFGDQNARVISATLKPSFNGTAASEDIRLNGAFVKGVLSVNIPLPKNTVPSLYDLCISYDVDGARREDCNDHAVAVIDKYKKSFRFAVLSDIHVGDPFVPNMDQGIPGRTLRMKAFEVLNKEAPDFVLISGDLISYPWSFKQDYPECYRELRDYVRVPIFMVPGNHDYFNAKKGLKNKLIGKDYWAKTFGPSHLSFRYDRYFFIGLFSFDWPQRNLDLFSPDSMKLTDSLAGGIISADEFKWFESRIQTAKAGNLEPVVFAHHPPDDLAGTGGGEIALLGANLVTYEKPSDFFNYLKDNGVRYYFYGHIHRRDIRQVDGISLCGTRPL
jgi:predicted phosphodiesterase